ncbi:MAG: zinc ribbon domain-containing protein [Thermotogae bacterium]|nr:zinc ribbon domain-containing protein [Thermotogota bacterium]
MPIYRYVCTTCEREIEVFQKMSDEPLTVCPHCGGKLVKSIGSVGVIFKGSGFYVTDSKKNGSKPESKATTSSSNKEGEKSE